MWSKGHSELIHHLEKMRKEMSQGRRKPSLRPTPDSVLCTVSLHWTIALDKQATTERSEGTNSACSWPSKTI